MVNNELKTSIVEIEQAINSVALESALKGIIQLASKLAISSRKEDHRFLFGSKCLDKYTNCIGSLALGLIPNYKQEKLFDDSLVIYLATEVYELGGHTRVMLDFIHAQPKSRHILILTNTLNKTKESQKTALSWFEVLGVEVVWLEDQLLLARLLKIQSLLIAQKPSKVFLLNHHQDAVLVAGCQPGLAKHFIYYHHCDHAFALGMYVSHFEHVDLSPKVFHTCREKLGLNNYYLPLAIQDRNNIDRKVSFFQSGSLRTASSGMSLKYISSDPEDYFYMIAIRLAELPGTHIHIGYIEDNIKYRLQKLCIERGVDLARVICIPWVESLWDALYEWNVDVYIPSFPLGGGRAAIEVMGAGIPIAVRDLKQLNELNGIDIFYPEVYRWSHIDELIKLLRGLNNLCLSKASKNARRWYEKSHQFHQLEQSLAGLPERLSDIEIPDSPSLLVSFLPIDKPDHISTIPDKPKTTSKLISTLAETNLDNGDISIRTIAFYLPQFHPIPENDQWWGKGFTEWRNVTKAIPLFENHYQPHLPSDLGFYDLRLPEILEEQAKLAQRYGIHGFCYYYYWFNGRRLLEKPINNMLKSGKPDFPFCLCWANENWTRRWDGSESEILMEQTYDETNSYQIIHDLLPSLLDRRYIRINNKPLLLVYRTDIVPNVNNMLNIWRLEAKKAGLIDLYLVRVESFYTCNPKDIGFDAACEFPPHTIYAPNFSSEEIKIPSDFRGNVKDYKLFANAWINRPIPPYKLFRSIMPSWDNTARRGYHATIFVNSSPLIYKNWLEKLVNHTLLNFDGDERLIFINAWNEWAEGCHLEPDIRYGHQFLEATQQALVLSTPIDYNYCNWINKHHWHSNTCQALKKLSDQWIFTPVINILMNLKEKNQQDSLIKSINSLKEQTIHLWRLIVILPSDLDNSGFDTDERISWIKIESDQNARYFFSNVDMDNEADWVLICEPGTYFEPIFSNIIGELINHSPEYRLIYTDEDAIDEKGNFLKPLFKPDSNLDLLRSTGYIGYACLIHRDLWRQIPSTERASSNLLLNYVAALRCHEIFGEEAIKHIDEILLHYPLMADADSQQFENLGKLFLQEHLWRQGILAEVNPGLVKSSFFVDYQLSQKPLVSIIIPTKNRLDLLQPCVKSLLEKTRYSNYEVIIVDNCSTDPATLAYLEQLPSHDTRFKVLRYTKIYNYSAINNFAAQHAKGDFVLLLNNDTVILQENWLDRMVAIGLRQDVGAVGCRLVYADQRVQHAGVILGLGGVAEHIGIGLSMNDPGYQGRAQLTQNFSAVTAACMLVRKQLFFDVDGLDEKDFAVLYNDIDLCLKLGERGYRIVWTPFVTLIHHGNSSLKEEKDTERDNKNLISQRAFIKKWLHHLGYDPAYNRHLSLRQREWMIDGDFDVPWHPDLESLPRIVAQAPDEMGVGQYRVIGPIKELTASEQICSFLLPPLNSDKRFLPSVAELARAKPTVLFLQNAFSDFHFNDLQSYAECLPNIFRIFGQDDIVFSVPPKSSARKHFGKDTKSRVRRAVSLCHRVITTTEPIAEALRGMSNDIRVMPNYLERSRWGDLPLLRKDRRKPRVGWAGAQQHGGDLEFILPVVEATANEVDWIFMGMCPPKLRYHVAEVHNAVPFEQYPTTLAALDLDLAIAPLELNRFNTAKSNLRLLEYGAIGYSVICTDILPYQNAPVTRVPNNPTAWINAIREQVHELDATHAAGEQLRKWVLSNWMLDQHLDEWLHALLPG